MVRKPTISSNFFCFLFVLLWVAWLCNNHTILGISTGECGALGILLAKVRYDKKSAYRYDFTTLAMGNFSFTLLDAWDYYNTRSQKEV